MFFSATEMLEEIPEDTQIILFNGNNIPYLEWNVFGYWAELSKLEVKKTFFYLSIEYFHILPCPVLYCIKLSYDIGSIFSIYS